MPVAIGTRPLKSWRYVAFFSPGLIACEAHIRIGPVRDSFAAVWEREGGLLWHRAGDLRLSFEERGGIETVCRAGDLYAWTRKRAPLPATAAFRGRVHAGHVLIDDTAAYYERHTRWYWSAGVGRARTGEIVAWNLAAGVNDPPRNSERTLWIDGVAQEPGPCSFAPDLRRVDDLCFSAEATLARRVNLGLVRSDYRQPMGSFSGSLPGGVELDHALGVMEHHDAWW